MIRAVFVWGVMLWCTLNAEAQVPRLDWRTMPESSYLPDQIQIRLKPEAFQYFNGHMLANAGTAGLGIPALDSIWQYFGFTTYQRLVDIPLAPSKIPLLPEENKVLRWVRLHLQHPKHLKPALEALENCTAWVEMAEPVYKTETHHMAGAPFFNDPWLPNDSLFNRQWHYHNTGQTGGRPDADIDLPEAWNIERGHPSVVVSVLDNGIDTLHPDLRPMLSPLRGYNFFANNNLLVPGNHGNHVAGTIAARTNNNLHVSGIAGGDGENGSGARLVSCQIFGVPNGSGGVENAFVWSAQNGVAISNNSWGYTVPGSYNESVIDAIDFFIENGGGNVLRKGLVIFSAGNSNDYATRWPAGYHKVIGVTATNHRDVKAWYSTFHEMMDIAAPGGELNEFSGGPLVDNGRRGILSTITLPNGATGFQQGTSMAAPHVSGVAALIASHGRGRLSADDVKSILLTQSDEIDSYQAIIHRNRMGEGRLNAHKGLLLTQQLMQLPEVKPPFFLQAKPACGNIQLSWQKFNASDEILVAVSTNENRGGLFGIPTGELRPGDNIPGGGKIIYKGAAEAFVFSDTNPEELYFFKAWTVDASSYSLGVVAPDAVGTQTSIAWASAAVNCYESVNLTWSFTSGCSNTRVLIAFDTEDHFGIPQGEYQPGDTLGTATVIYVGNGNGFVHTLPVLKDGAKLYYRIWAIRDNGGYESERQVNAQTPPAIRNASVRSSLPTGLLSGWERNSCFSGDVLLAVNTVNQFGEPEGILEVGDVLLPGGAKIIYKGKDKEFFYGDLIPNQIYYFSIWPVLGNNTFGLPMVFLGRTTCTSDVYALPFRDTINTLSLQGCTFDTLGFRNFTAGPLPRLSVLESGLNPSVQPASGRYMVGFNSFDTRETNQVWLTSPSLNSVGISSVDVAFRWYEDNSDYNSEFFEGEGVTVLWSIDNVNWDTVMFFPRITQYGGNGWKYKQVTLPEGAAQQPWLLVRWVFNSRWGMNCYIDELSVIATTPKTAPALFTKGVAQFVTGSGLTHYYDTLQQLVLSIETSGQNIGHVDEGLLLGSGGTSSPHILPAQGNYVTNPVGWVVTGRYWHIGQWQAPQSAVKVHHYYHPSELKALEALARQGNSPILVPGDTLGLMSYMLSGALLSQVDPATGHVGVTLARQYGQTGFWQLDPGMETDTLHYTTYPAFGQWRTTVQDISVPSSGGLGAGSPKGNGALLPHWINLTAVRQNRNTVLNWTTGYERYWQMMEVEFATIPEGIFRHLEFIPPFGLPQEGNTYTYTDSRILPNGRYRYRIKATDFNGRKLMSPEVEVTNNDVKGLLIFPNPANRGTLNIFSETPMKWLRIVDGLGRVVFSAQPGATQYRGQLPVLASGVYFVQASILEGIVVQKLLIQP